MAKIRRRKRAEEDVKGEAIERVPHKGRKEWANV